MAYFSSFSAFNIYNIDLNYFLRNFYSQDLYDENYYSYGNYIYADIIDIQTQQGEFFSLFGFDFQVDPNSYITAGTVQSMEFIQNGLPIWYAEDIIISASAIDSALLTLSSLDDYAVLGSGFGGDDLFELSDYNDICFGFDGSDTILGLFGHDHLDGGLGDDLIEGGEGNDFIDGGFGFDTAKFSGLRSDYIVETDAFSGKLIVTDLRGLEGTDTLININRLQFFDEIVDTNTNDLVLPKAFVTYFRQTNINQVVLGTFTPSAAFEVQSPQSIFVQSLGSDSYAVLNGDGFFLTELAGTTGSLSGIITSMDLYDAGLLVATVTGLQMDADAFYQAVLNPLLENPFYEGYETVNLGSAGDDIFYGGDGSANEIIVGNDGIDTLTYEYAEFGGVSANLELASSTKPLGGTDYITGIENLTGSAQSDVLVGNGGANILIGLAGSDTLDGGGGVDTLIGGLGYDTYITDGGDTIIEDDVAGIDTVKSSVSYVLGSNLENLVLIGTLATNGTGNALDNEITGNIAANILNGAGGNDILRGGLGDDTYFVDGGDVIIEAFGSGIDTVHSSVSKALGSNLENLVLTGSGVLNGAGNILDNVITGNSATNLLTGYAGNDVLNGGTGSDSLIGGLGNDTYITDGGDTITELLSEGTDTVRSSVSYTLGANIENLVLTGSAAINGTGNTLNNVITGNSAANTLNGGSGNDILNGGGGNDIYVINGGDTIVEAAAAGTDTVQSTVAYTLGLNLENLTLTGTAAINGTGNTLNNVITGNGAANTLNGGIGNDTLNGGLGNDRLIGGVGNDIYVINGGDTIVEAAAAGTDTVQSTVAYTLGLNLENLTLTGSGIINGTGNTLNNVITGNGAANTLNGGAGNDRITGGLGKDTLVGGAGTDTFVFNKINESTTVSTTWDIITDFTKGQDKIDLRSIDAFAPSAANDAFLWKGTAAFSSASAGEARYQKYDNAGTANDYTVVFLDNDADTAVEMAIRLHGLHNLAATDFMV